MKASVIKQILENYPQKEYVISFEVNNPKSPLYNKGTNKLELNEKDNVVYYEIIHDNGECAWIGYVDIDYISRVYIEPK